MKKLGRFLMTVFALIIVFFTFFCESLYSLTKPEVELECATGINDFQDIQICSYPADKASDSFSCNTHIL